jgi:hypothetical protein
MVRAAGFSQFIWFFRNLSVCDMAIIKRATNHISQTAVPDIRRTGLFQTKPMADNAEARSFITIAIKNKRILGVGCIFKRGLFLHLTIE